MEGRKDGGRRGERRNERISVTEEMIGHTARERWVRWRVAAEVSAAVIRFPPASSLCSHAAPPDQRPDRTWDTWAAFMFPSESQGGRWWTKCRTFTRDQFNHPESICGSVKATGSSHSSRVTADFCCVFNLTTEALRDKWALFSCLFITSEQVKETFSYVFKISSFNMWNRTKGKEIFYSEVETKVCFSSSFYLWNKIPIIY